MLCIIAPTRGASVTSSNTANNALWAHNPSNGSTWKIGGSEARIQGDYVEANGRLFYRVYGNELWTYEPSNGTVWKVTDASPNGKTFTSLGNTVYFTSDTNPVSSERWLWAHNTANETTWFVTNISASNWGWTYSGGIAHPEVTSLIFAGDTIYIREGGGMRAHQPASINYQTNTGGAVTSWAINASLPTGLTFSTTNGSIYGTPTQLWTQTSYMVWANNSGGSSVAYLNITVIDELPTIAYTPAVLDLTNNTVSADLPLAPTITGDGEITSWEINATLPDGLSFGATNGTIWGTPTELSSTTAYMVWANNSGGSSVAYLNITVVDELPTISYTPAALDLANNTLSADLPLAPTITGAGEITSWEINATLPDGLSFGATNGTIWGTPTELWTQTSYMVWANNSGGSSVAYLNITVVDEVPTLSYTPNSLVLTKGQQSNDFPLTAALSGSGVITSWEINATLPAGLNFGTSNGTIWGIPTVLQTTASTYTIWANNTGGSTSATVTIAINDQVSGPFEYIPEDNIWTNNSYVNIGPSFINTTTGNGSTWEVANINSGSASSNAGQYMITSIGDVIYFSANAANAGHELWAYNASNSTTWLVKEIRPGSSGSNPGGNMVHAINGVLYFNAMDGSSGQELWKHDPSTGTTSRIYDIRPGSSGSSLGLRMSMVVGDVLFFSANDGNSGHELWAYNTSNGSNPWRVMDINSGSDSSNPGHWLEILVGDTLYFSADDGSTGHELWAHDASNHSTWQVTDISSGSGDGNPGRYMQILVGDTIYFSATDGSTGDELWAHNTSNGTTWRVADIYSGASGSMPGSHMNLLVGDTIYFDAAAVGGVELWAHDISNQSTWRVVDIYTGSIGSDPGDNMAFVVGDTLYFDANDGISGDELWAHDTSNHSTWRVTDIINGVSGSSPAAKMSILVGDTIYFDADDYFDGHELWAHDVSNQSTWQVADISGGSRSSNPGHYSEILVGDTLYFSADDGNTGFELWAHRPSLINHQTNTAGSVTSYAINATLPDGLSFGTTNGTIWGTPTELWTQTSYMVWANNSGGSSLAYLNITVVDELPTISYTPAALDLTNNTVSADLPLTPTITGAGEITSWEINATLPDGLSLGSTNGTIWGTPTELSSTTAYMVWANNSGGSSLAYLNITVVDELPTISYSPSDFQLMNNTASSDLPLVPVITGSGEITSWEINATLPDGLSFGATNGTIWGTPTELWTTTAYMVWANNSGGSSVAYLNITVVDELPGLSYNPNNLELTNNTLSSDFPLNPTIIGSGQITSWEINTTLPAGLNFGTSNGTIWGIPTVLQTTATTYTIWANNSGGSSSATVTITINDEAPGPIEYIPENNTWTNNSYVNIGPSFINQTSGNGSTWAVSLPNTEFAVVVGDVVYLTGEYLIYRGDKFYAFNTSNGTGWDPNPTWYLENGSTSVYATYDHGRHMSYLIGDVIYFDANWAGGPVDLWAYNTSNNSGWLVKDINTVNTYQNYNSNPGKFFSTLMGDTIYFSANSGNASLGAELWAHDTSNGTTWRVGYTNTTGTLPNTPAFPSYGRDLGVIGDTIYFQAWGSSGEGMWAYNTSNTTMWEIDFSSAVRSVNPGKCMSVVVGDSLYFDADGSTHGRELWAHNHANQTTWMVKDLEPSTFYQGRDGSPGCGGMSGVLVGDTFYFTAKISYTNGNYELWAHNTSNHSTWLVADIMSSSTSGSLPGYRFAVVIGDTIYFDANDGGSSTQTARDLWAHDTSNKSTWKVYNFSQSGNQGVELLLMAVGDTVYFRADDTWTPHGGLWAHDTSNQSTWLVENGSSGLSWGFPGVGTNFFVNGTLYTSLSNCNTYSPGCNAGYNLLSINYQTNTGGNVTSWAINGSLPSGVTFNNQTGVLSGTPTELWPQTSYMVWANNSGGSSIAYLNITINDQLPTISYSPANLTLTNNTNSTEIPLAPTITGQGDILTWEINGTLPSGMFFGGSNGTIYGTPTELWNQTQYMVWANNTGGSAITYLNITVVDQLPGINYSPDNLTFHNNTESLDLPLAPSITGDGVFIGWEISPDLPSGLNFGSDNGTIWGIATERMNMTMYTVWANNSGGASIAYLNITVIHQEPAFNYSVLDLVLVNNTQMTNVSANITGGEIVSWASSPDLPVGLNLESNGNISGTPTVVQNRTMYVIWANNTGGSHLVFINITIYDPIASLEYIPENITLTRNETMANLSAIHSGIIDSWAIYPELPAGLNFTNGTISGTPQVNMTRTTFTVWANNTGGAMSHTINITINEPAVVINYVPSAVVLVNNTNSTDLPMIPIIEGEGVVDTWEIWPALPSGLNFSTSNGTISGIATELQVIPVNYTIWANNTGGISMFNISITIIDQLPNVTYPYDLELINNTNSTYLPMVPIINGSGEIVTWEINATLPAGLNFSSENGTISGIARELMNKTQFTVWANNSGGSVMMMFNITVVDEVPDSFTYSTDKLELTRNENNSESLPFTPSIYGSGEIISWGINRTLPSGLNFSSENGTIWGIPVELMVEWQNFTIYANNSGGSINTTVMIRVIDQIPTISYNFTQAVLKNDTVMTPIEATIGGGPITVLDINPDLPAGLNFGHTNGTIWGMPTELTDKIEYTVAASNSGGVTLVKFFITIEDKKPMFYYPSSELVVYVDTSPSELPLEPLSFAGEVENWSISPKLPEGLYFGELNGTIWGTPLDDIFRTQFTITAYNPIGEYSVMINLTVVDFVYNFKLDPVWIANGTFMPEIIPSYQITGATYGVVPELPYGISINPNNGVISGKANETTDLASYTLYAKVDGYTLMVPLEFGVIPDNDFDGMPDAIPKGGNALNLVEDDDDDNDGVEDLSEVECKTDPFDADDTPKFDDKGNCLPEEEGGYNFMICLPIILLLLLIIVAVIAKLFQDKKETKDDDDEDENEDDEEKSE